jgi:hypothetical protein
MCLELIVTVPEQSPERLEELARSCSSAGPLEVAAHHDGWFRRIHNLRVSEPGEGCACSMLADNARWDSETWALRPEATTKLVETMQRVTDLAIGPWTFEARWDSAAEERSVTPAELLDVIARGAIGIRTQYVVRRAG